MSYFAIERGKTYIDHATIRDRNEDVLFGNYADLSYNDLKEQNDLDDFVTAVIEATDSVGDDQAIITLIGEDDIFIWSIIMGVVDGEIRYNLVDWKADGKNYRYEPS